jgi:uncharacterized membrane protein YraQ (UPF0718 family)
MSDQLTRMRPRVARRAQRIGLLAAAGGLAAVFVVRALTGDIALVDLPNAAQDLVTLTVSVMIESLGFVVLGILISILVQVWVPDRWIVRVLPRNAAARRVVISVLGVLLPVCECGNVPLSRGLIAKGFSVPEAMTFLVAAPIVNPVTILTTYQVFGFDDGILVSRVVGGFLIANLVGWLFSQHPAPGKLLTEKFAAECALPAAGDHDHDHDHGHDHGGSRWQESRDLFAREAAAVMPALVIGSFIAGLVQVAVPRSVLVTLGSNPVWSVLALMALAFVISICSNIDAFFILPFASTFMPGGVVAFLLFGPIIDIKMLAMMRTTFTTTILVQITTVVALTSATIGFMVNYLA